MKIRTNSETRVTETLEVGLLHLISKPYDTSNFKSSTMQRDEDLVETYRTWCLSEHCIISPVTETSYTRVLSRILSHLIVIVLLLG